MGNNRDNFLLKILAWKTGPNPPSPTLFEKFSVASFTSANLYNENPELLSFMISFSHNASSFSNRDSVLAEVKENQDYKLTHEDNMLKE